MKISQSKINKLIDDFAEVSEEIIETFEEFILAERQNNPGFFRWLFSDHTLDDYDCTLEQEECFDKFIKNIKRGYIQNY